MNFDQKNNNTVESHYLWFQIPGNRDIQGKISDTLTQDCTRKRALTAGEYEIPRDQDIQDRITVIH